MRPECPIEVRKLKEFSEFHEAVELQKRIWGFHEVDLLPVRLFIVASTIGGHAFGAFADSRMIAFCLAIPGLKPGGGAYLHSHMLGVLEDYRNTGVGRRLKLAQREEALGRGIGLIEWTFDPLELKNAFFNIERLGAIIRRFVFNQYGTTSSALHGGLPTDRCVAEWRLNSDRVIAAVEGQTLPPRRVEERVEVPANVARIRESDPSAARHIQQLVSEQLDKHLSAGLAVIGFERSAEYGTYLLGRWHSE